MSEREHKKRKRHSASAQTPSKKIALDDGSHPQIKVSFRADGPAPVLASVSGLTIPPLKFNSYVNGSRKDEESTADPRTHKLLLHSSKHVRLDYTATPDAQDTDSVHYLAIFDPSTEQLELLPAHHLNLRSVVRAEGDNGLEVPKSMAQRRLELGREFGSVRSKKALEGRAANAIIQSGKEQMSKTEQAILSSVAETVDTEAMKTEAADDLFASRPIPKPNLKATERDEVYTFNTLIPPETARLIDHKELQEQARSDIAVQFNHRFPAYRLNDVGKIGSTKCVKALRYIALLLDFHDVLIQGGRESKRVPGKEALARKLAGWPQELVETVVARFADRMRELPKRHLDQFYTHICALSLFVDGWLTNTVDLRDDLSMDNKQITKYFRELGCAVRKPTKAEEERMKIKKQLVATTRIAELKIPLDFPKVSVGRQNRR